MKRKHAIIGVEGLRSVVEAVRNLNGWERSEFMRTAISVGPLVMIRSLGILEVSNHAHATGKGTLDRCLATLGERYLIHPDGGHGFPERLFRVVMSTGESPFPKYDLSGFTGPLEPLARKDIHYVLDLLSSFLDGAVKSNLMRGFVDLNLGCSGDVLTAAAWRMKAAAHGRDIMDLPGDEFGATLARTCVGILRDGLNGSYEEFDDVEGFIRWRRAVSEHGDAPRCAATVDGMRLLGAYADNGFYNRRICESVTEAIESDAEPDYSMLEAWADDRGMLSVVSPDECHSWLRSDIETRVDGRDMGYGIRAQVSGTGMLITSTTDPAEILGILRAMDVLMDATALMRDEWEDSAGYVPSPCAYIHWFPAKSIHDVAHGLESGLPCDMIAETALCHRFDDGYYECVRAKWERERAARMCHSVVPNPYSSGLAHAHV